MRSNLLRAAVTLAALGAANPVIHEITARDRQALKEKEHGFLPKGPSYRSKTHTCLKRTPKTDSDLDAVFHAEIKRARRFTAREENRQRSIAGQAKGKA